MHQILVLVDVGQLARGRLLADDGDTVGVLGPDLLALLFALVCSNQLVTGWVAYQRLGASACMFQSYY